jgi:hypothetical protein
MSSQTVIVIFIASIAVLMATAFLVVWWRDSKNADEVAADPERLDTDNATGGESIGEVGSAGTPNASIATDRSP